CEVALEERLELDEERKLLVAAQALLQQVLADRHLLLERDAHRSTASSRGSLNCNVSTVVIRSSTSTPPSAPIAAIRRLTSDSGAEAPAVTATVVAPRSQATSTSVSSSTRYAREPSRCATSTSRFEFEEVCEPTTSTIS